MTQANSGDGYSVDEVGEQAFGVIGVFLVAEQSTVVACKGEILGQAWRNSKGVDWRNMSCSCRIECVYPIQGSSGCSCPDRM